MSTQKHGINVQYLYDTNLYFPQHRRKLNTYKNIHKINILHLFELFYTIPSYLPSFPPNCRTFLHFFFNLKNLKIQVCIQYHFHWIYALWPKSCSVLDTFSIFWTLFVRAEHWAFYGGRDLFSFWNNGDKKTGR